MSPNAAEALDPYRERVIAGVRALLDESDLTHIQLVREHIESLADTGTPVFDAAAVHLLAAEGFGGNAGAALPVASALALLALSTDVMRTLRSNAVEPAGGLESAWGMPRTLNAGDACYALAQKSFAKLDECGLLPEDVIRASSALRAATFGLCEDLLDQQEAGARRAVVTAVQLALITRSDSGEPAVVSGGEMDRLLGDAELPTAATLRALGFRDAAARSLGSALDDLAKERWL